MRRTLLVAGVLLLSPGVFAAGDTDGTMVGATLYKERCVLCHGNQGMGEGILPLSIKGYPNTNLLKPRFPVDSNSLRDTIVHGGSDGHMSKEMPPWGDELTDEQITALVGFTELLRSNHDRAMALLATVKDVQGTSARAGGAIFKSRCALCHGEHGKGDGKMARIIKDPPPFNLTLSGAPDEYLRQIIQQGGEAMGRSPRMPPWGKELTASQLESVIAYLKTIRVTP
jgi:cbb3-type cytochrome c oxidase subunit III